MNGIDVRTIEDVCARVTSGGTPSRRVPEYFDGNIPWLKTQELRDGWVYEAEEHITETALRNSAAKLLPPNTVLMAMYGATVGQLALLGREMTCNQAACAMIVDPSKADFRYLYYALLNDRPRIIGRANGAAQQNLSARIIKSLDYRFPSLEEQHAISATLGALDDKIEANRRAIDRMEALGSALLEEALGLDVYGFPKYAADRRLGDMLSTLETGSRPKGGISAATRGVVSLGAESIQSAGVTSTTVFKHVPEDFAASMRRGRLVDGDVLVYKDGGSPGNFIPHVSAFGYGFPVAVATINEHVYRVRAVDGISQGLLYWLLRSSWMDEEMRKRGTGVAIPGLNHSNFKDLPWPVMDDNVANRLGAQLDLLVVRMLKFGAQSRQLAALRDTLLPELLSGRIRVPVEGVAV